MHEVCDSAGSFLQSLFEGTGLELSVTIKESPTECLLDLSGPDSELLQAESGELLQALQHLVNQVYGRKLEEGQRLVCDVQGFRAAREAELRAMAKLAAERVRSSGMPFTFGEMNSQRAANNSPHTCRMRRSLYRVSGRRFCSQTPSCAENVELTGFPVQLFVMRWIL